jgi:hypothetical protein
VSASLFALSASRSIVSENMFRQCASAIWLEMKCGVLATQ